MAACFRPPSRPPRRAASARGPRTSPCRKSWLTRADLSGCPTPTRCRPRAARRGGLDGGRKQAAIGRLENRNAERIAAPDDDFGRAAAPAKAPRERVIGARARYARDIGGNVEKFEVKRRLRLIILRQEFRAGRRARGHAGATGQRHQKRRNGGIFSQCPTPVGSDLQPARTLQEIGLANKPLREPANCAPSA